MLFALLVYSLWSIYVTALRRGKRRMSTSGLTTIGAMATGFLWLVLLALAAAFLYFLYLAFTYDLDAAVTLAQTALYDYGYGFLSQLLGLQGFDLVLVLYAGSSALCIVLFASLAKTVSTVKGVITTGAPDGRGALTAGILCFLLAGGSVALSLAPLNEEMYLPAALTLLGALGQLSFGLLCFLYRFRMARVSAYNVRG